MGDAGVMIEVRTASGRFETLEEGRTTRHSFSFGAHYDPGNVGFASLVAHNDELLPPGTGYAEHPHADTEILSVVVSGALRHTSTAGSGELGPGEVQLLSAGSGVRHSEVTAPGVATRFVQAWVRPDVPGTPPSWHRAAGAGRPAGPGAGPAPGWTCVAAGSGGALLPLGTRGAALHDATLHDGERLDLPDAPALHLFVVAEGPSHGVMVGERRLLDGDAARLHDEGGRTVSAVGATEPVRLLVWAFDRPLRAPAPRG